MNSGTSHIEIGRVGENTAKKYLESKGYKIIEQNYKTPYLEIDLIGSFKGVLVFFEVRTKVGEAQGTPEETIDKRKIKKLIKNAQIYTSIKNYYGSYRIDVVCIVLNENLTQNRLTHYENITG